MRDFFPLPILFLKGSLSYNGQDVGFLRKRRRGGEEGIL